LIITGDIKQSDLKEVNGLEDFLERLDKKYSDSQTMFQDGVSLVRFDQNCIERHPVITKILSLYD
jgi:phosphate starvation-inducible protein PhoH